MSIPVYFSQIHTSAQAVQPDGDSISITLHYNVCYLTLGARPALAVYWEGKNALNYFSCFFLLKNLIEIVATIVLDVCVFKSIMFLSCFLALALITIGRQTSLGVLEALPPLESIWLFGEGCSECFTLDNTESMSKRCVH